MPVKKLLVISLGGSTFIPEPGRIDFAFLKNFRKLLFEFINKKWKFILVIGGGKTSRMYQAAALKITKLSDQEQDWLGIQATKLNAHLLKIIFQPKAWPEILDQPLDKINPQMLKKPVIIASGWQPGRSTDYVAVLLAQKLGVKKIINATNVPFVYDQNKKKILKISWSNYRKIIAKKWKPGLSTPFDPIAAQKAAELNLKTIIIKGTDLKNLAQALKGDNFKGTIIED